MRHLRELEQAEAECAPVLGPGPLEFNTAADVYRAALDKLGVDTKGIQPGDLAAVYRAHRVVKGEPVARSDPLPTPAADKLTRKQGRFVHEYLVDLCAADAARRAGYSERTAKQIAHELLKRPPVRAAIDKELAARKAQYPALHARTVDQLSNLVFADPRALFDEQGRPKPIHELTAAQAASIAGIECEEVTRGGEDDPVTVRITKIRLTGKVPAAELLAKITGALHGGGGIAVQVNVNAIPNDPVAASAAYARIINGSA